MKKNNVLHTKYNREYAEVHYLYICVLRFLAPPLFAGADPGFQVRGANVKQLRRVEGGANIFGVFRVKNHDFTPKNPSFSNCGGAKIVGIFRVKVTILRQKFIFFSNLRGGARRVRPPPPWIRPWFVEVLVHLPSQESTRA